MLHKSVANYLRRPAVVPVGAFRIQHHSTQTVPSGEVNDLEWDSALPYSKIPSPTLWHSLQNYKPGGRYHKASITQLHQLYREDFGDIVRFPGMLGRKDVVMTYRPDDFEKLFRTEGQWPIRRGLDTFVQYRKNVRADLFKGLGGLVTEQGESWQKFRSIVNPIMLQPKTVQMYVGKLDEVSRQFMKIMLNTRDENNELPADFDQWLNRWALETMGVLALDTRFGVLDEQESEEARNIVKYTRELFELVYQLDVLPSIWKYYKTPTYNRLMTVFDKLSEISMGKVDEAVKRLEKNPSASSDNQSVLEKLLKINRDVAIVMAYDMVLGGVDTTTSAISGILYCLATHPEKQDKLREELRTILPKKDSPLTSESMRSLPYLRACIKEGMRLYSPVFGNLRAAGRDIVLQGYQIPKGTDVAMASMIVQQDDRFIPRAKEFLPERWLKQTEGCPSIKDAHPFVYLPFGNGPRTCIGRRLAMLEMEILVSRITRLFDYRWNYGELQMKATLVNTPVNELRFQMKEVDV